MDHIGKKLPNIINAITREILPNDKSQPFNLFFEEINIHKMYAIQTTNP